MCWILAVWALESSASPLEEDASSFLLSDKDLIVALNIPDDFFYQQEEEEEDQTEGDGRLIVLDTGTGTGTGTGPSFPHFKARGEVPRRGKVLREEEETPPVVVRVRKPRTENSLTFNLSSKSKFSPASHRFVHHQVRPGSGLDQTLSKNIDQFIRKCLSHIIRM